MMRGPRAAAQPRESTRDRSRAIDTAANAGAPESTRFQELDSLRGIAMLFVVAAHVRHEWLFWAWSWMDMFFVLSSFLLTRIVYRKCTDARGVIAFYGRRIERIWPLYLLTVSALFVVALALNHRQPGAIDLITFARLYTFSQYSEMLFHPVMGYPHLYYARHLWSLAVEEQFYILLPLALLVLRALPKSLALTAVALLVAGSVLLRFRDANLYILSSPDDAFALGSLMALGFETLQAHARIARRWLIALLLIGLAVLLPYIVEGYIALLRHRTVAPYAAWPATFSTLAWVAIVGLLALHRGHAALRWMRAGWLTHLGHISYAVYLIHYPILRLVPDLLVGRVPGLTPLTAALACLPLIAVLGELLYRFIDRPLQLRGAPRTRS